MCRRPQNGSVGKLESIEEVKGSGSTSHPQVLMSRKLLCLRQEEVPSSESHGLKEAGKIKHIYLLGMKTLILGALQEACVNEKEILAQSQTRAL